MKDYVLSIMTLLLIIGLLVFGIVAITDSYNNKQHSDDVTITEWISPDGVHYWYQMAGYHAMLAPRYDSNGSLVIEGE